jgi:DNA-binding MarR family transcriptional regulator
MPPDKGEAAHERRTLDGLYGSPEFLIRRAHQVATSVFAEACADLALTTSQYATLYALRQCAPLGQNELGRLVALDRSTTSIVVRSLKERGLVAAGADAADRRKSLLELTHEGRTLLVRAERRSSKSSQALLSVFDRRQAATLLELLAMLSSKLESRPGLMTDCE